ncbi:MAG: cupin domain-containing protein, partial [Burkholderiales bacterium]|nr:cupin domain-containing protein [Burkholderiales bacterium]
MDLNAPLALLGGLTPAAFMRRHWQKKPLLVRQAWPAAAAPLERAALFELAASDDVESRLVDRRDGRWRVRQGPLARRSLPPIARPHWTLLVQGLDLHVAAARELLERFRFIPDARVDDLMLSWASDGGGVGPHLDDYDVFLIQVQGRRRWRIGRVADESWLEGVPLKILRRFEPEHDWVLEPGDLLYLPPGWGHDGVAEGECMTASAGFRVPSQQGLAREIVQRLAEDEDDAPRRLYRDPRQPAAERPAEIPAPLADFARRAVQQALERAGALERALGEVLSEPKPRVWFEGRAPLRPGQGVVVDAKTRMLYDARHLFVNGESF